MKTILILISTFCLIGCKSISKDNLNENKKIPFVSLLSVIANPEKYHQKTIIVEGYFIMESEGDAIYISKSDCENMLTKNGVYLYTNINYLSKMGIEAPYKGYVRIKGIFNKDLKGSYNFYSGTFTEVIDVSRKLKKGTKMDEYNMD